MNDDNNQRPRLYNCSQPLLTTRANRRNQFPFVRGNSPRRDAAPAINPTPWVPRALRGIIPLVVGSNCGATRVHGRACCGGSRARKGRPTDENSTLEMRRTYVARNAPQESYIGEGRRGEGGREPKEMQSSFSFSLSLPPRPFSAPIRASRAELPRSSRCSGCVPSAIIARRG